MVFKSLIYKLEVELLQRLPASSAPTNGSRLLHLGCGEVQFPGWINADLPRLPFLRDSRLKKPDWSLDVQRKWACPANYWQGIFTEHMLEHLNYKQAKFALSECLRTLAPDAGIRIVVPDLEKYIDFYNGHLPDPEFNTFSSGAVAISNIAQNYGHRSLWDVPLLVATLSEIGFADATGMAFREGRDSTIIKDRADRRWESLYVEARKP